MRPRLTLQNNSPHRYAPPVDERVMLTDVFWAAVEAGAPGRALASALERVHIDPARRVWVISLGKAALRMAETAVEWLRSHHAHPAGGIVVAPEPASTPHPLMSVVAGDHPVPGLRSFEAAARLGVVVARVRPPDEVWVLLSGGASSLVAAPEGAINPAELVDLYRLLLASGLDIAAVNTIRKRFARWGAGRLAQALAPARVRCFAISDVIGDDLTVIGSGPCVPDPSTALEVHALLADTGLWSLVPPSMRRYLLAVERDAGLETPKPGEAAFWEVDRRVIASNRASLDAASARAADYGYRAHVLGATLSGEASTVGRRIASSMLGPRDASGPGAERSCLIWGGETTVTLSDCATTAGGRCQELALAAARQLGDAREATNGIALLAAGTDGRDGPTDAAGAIVTNATWSRAIEAGRDPVRDLHAHETYASLDAAGALLRTGLTGTNVMDIVVGIRG